MKHKWISGEWRETCSPFINYLDRFGMLHYDFFEIGKTKIPYLDVRNTVEDDYIMSFVNLFLHLAGIEESVFYFVFFPRCEDDEFQKEMLNKICLEFSDKKIAIMFNQDIAIKDIRLTNAKTVTYNSVLQLKEYSDFSDYMEKQPGKHKRFLKRSIRIFSDNRDFVIDKIDLNSSLDNVIDLYVQCCIKHDDFMESKKFLMNLKFIDNVEWYGVYFCDKLVMFTGYWKNKESVILGMFGKDYKYEDLLRKNNVYFAFNLFLIQKAMEQNFDFLFSSFGEQDLKRQMGYEFENYGLVII